MHQQNKYMCLTLHSMPYQWGLAMSHHLRNRKLTQTYLSCDTQHLFPLTLYDLGGGLFLSSPPHSPKCCSHAFNSGATFLCVSNYSQTNSFTQCENNFFIRGHGLVIKGFSKFKVLVIFRIFRKFKHYVEIFD